jgi:ribosomal protein S18 acetylase RimI-like enzyme
MTAKTARRKPLRKSASKFIFLEAGADGLDRIQPLWQKLTDHHAGMSLRFAKAAGLRTFEARKQELLAKTAADRIRVDLVSTDANGPVIAYCVGTVTSAGVGEIDSIFIEEHWRCRRIGTELMRRALAWLDKMGAASKVVSVMCENEAAMAFYRRFDFHPRAVLLQQVAP